MRLDTLYFDTQRLIWHFVSTDPVHLESGLLRLECVNKALCLSVRRYFSLKRSWSLQCLQPASRVTVSSLQWILKHASTLKHVDLSVWCESPATYPQLRVSGVVMALSSVLTAGAPRFTLRLARFPKNIHDLDAVRSGLWLNACQADQSSLSAAWDVAESHDVTPIKPSVQSTANVAPSHIVCLDSTSTRAASLGIYLRLVHAFPFALRELCVMNGLTTSEWIRILRASSSDTEALYVTSANAPFDPTDVPIHFNRLRLMALCHVKFRSGPRTSALQSAFAWRIVSSAALTQLELHEVEGLASTDFYHQMRCCENLETISIQRTDLGLHGLKWIPTKSLISIILPQLSIRCMSVSLSLIQSYVRFRESGLANLSLDSRLAFLLTCPLLKFASIDLDAEMEAALKFVQFLKSDGEHLRALLSYNGDEAFTAYCLLRSATELRDSHQYQLSFDLLGLLLNEHPSCPAALLQKSETLLICDQSEEALETISALISQLEQDGSGDTVALRCKSHHCKAIALNRLGRNLEASQAISEALQTKDGDIWLWTDAATIHMELRNLSEALKCIDKALELVQNAPQMPESADQVWFRRGIILQKMKRYDDAIESLAHAIADHDCANYRYHMGEAFRKSMRPAESLIHYEASIRLQPANLVSWNSFGLAHSSMRNYEQAIDCFDHALIVAPEDPVIWANKGESLFLQGHYQSAIDCFDNSLSYASGAHIQPGFVWIRKGKALCLSGSYEDAVGCFDVALKEDPGSAIAWEWKGRSLFEQGQVEAALRCYNTALEIAPNDFYAWAGKALALDATGDLEQAISCFDRSIELNRINDLTFRWKGRALLKHGLHDEAVAAFDAAIDLCPLENSDHLYRRGMAYYGKGDYINAIACFARGLQLDPNDVDAWFDQGESLNQLGRYDEAIESYNKALTLCPRYEKARRSLQQLFKANPGLADVQHVWKTIS